MSEVVGLAELVEAAATGAGHDHDELVAEVRAHPDLAGVTDGSVEIDPAVAAAAAALLAGSGQPGDLAMVARLSLLAHQAGIEGAGRFHAEATDKIALYTGRPQRYGTVMIEQHGEVVQPRVDPRTSDDERAELGLPALAEMHDRMARLTRELAVERAGRPGELPDGQRWCRVWTDPSAAELKARMARDGSAWADGDVLTLVTESPVPVSAPPVFPIESWPVDDQADLGRPGLQCLQVRVERLAEAVITYRFATPDELGGFGRGSHDGRFRGTESPAELASHDDLVGSSFDHAVESEACGEPRRVTVYRPPGHEAGQATPVVYATDGNMIDPYLRRLDAAIGAGDCPPVVVVAAHSAPFDPLLGNLRAAEYLPGFDAGRFNAHHRFFVDELGAWAEAELGVTSDPARRGVFGCSDGAGHALMIARLVPERFGHVFAYSTGMPPELSDDWTAEHPFVHLCAGTLEGAFHQATEAWAGYLMMHGAAYRFTERVAGHDLIQWAEELPRSLARAWGRT